MANSQTAGCFHCGLSLSGTSIVQAEVAGQSRSFCCTGCRAVCVAIHNSGLEGFYRQIQCTPAAPPVPLSEEITVYDLDAVQKKFVTTLGPKRNINLVIDGIHCPACVWLIEHALAQIPGVEAANLNLSGKRLQLRWNNEQVLLSQILRRLSEIGYTALPFDPELSDGRLKRQNRAILYRIAFAGFAAMNLMWVAIALYTGAASGEFRNLFYWMGLILATPTLFYSGYPFFKGAWQGLRRLYPTMDLPIVIGATTTYAYSAYVTLMAVPGGEVYFDTMVNFLFVILVGRFLDAASRRKAVASTQRVFDLQPRGATVLRDGQEIVLPIDVVTAGEIVIVRPGAQIPVDGIIVTGQSAVDESMLTGESMLIAKDVGDLVCAGSMNHSGALVIKVTGTLRNTALGRILNLVEEAQSTKIPLQQIADKIVPWFVAITLLLASITFIWWWVASFSIALMAATAVLVVTCPCAFGLATPMAIAVASGSAARHGILVRNGRVLESLTKVTHVVFDKTGTLTQGRMQVQAIVTVPGITEHEVLFKSAAAERMSEHSIAWAILNQAKAKGLDPTTAAVEMFRSLPGRGISATVAGTNVILGNESWLTEHGIALDSILSASAVAWQHQAITCIHVALNGCEVGLIGITDQLRTDAKPLIQWLLNSGIELTLLSGDRRSTVEAIAAQLGNMRVMAEVLPQDKDNVIIALQQQGHRVAMIGDGVNDAPALARADVGIAMGTGTDISIANADLVLIGNELDKIRQAFLLSSRTLNVVWQNIGLSIAYNIIMVPLAMAALVTPLVAAIAMPISSLLVIGNATRIRKVFSAHKSQQP